MRFTNIHQLNLIMNCTRILKFSSLKFRRGRYFPALNMVGWLCVFHILADFQLFVYRIKFQAFKEKFMGVLNLNFVGAFINCVFFCFRPILVKFDCSVRQGPFINSLLFQPCPCSAWLHSMIGTANKFCSLSFQACLGLSLFSLIVLYDSDRS